jgi:hypothetical protein
LSAAIAIEPLNFPLLKSNLDKNPHPAQQPALAKLRRCAKMVAFR